MKSLNLKLAVAAVLLGASAMTFGAPPADKGPPDGKGNKPDSEVGNSLSVPAFIVGAETSPFENLVCAASWGEADLTAVAVTAEPVAYLGDCADTVSGDDEPYCMDTGNYFVQRVHPWQAPCVLGASAQAKAAWGDNLVGDASMKVGSPIRVELVLWDSTSDAAGEEGYYVIKLQPDELDRNSDYGHLAAADGSDIPRVVGSQLVPPLGTTVDPLPVFGAVVHDAEARLKIQLLDADSIPVSTVYDGDAGAEINATGKIVYGHNLRVGTAGTYRITYTVPNVTLVGIANVLPAKVPEIQTNADGEYETYLDIVVALGGGGGGKKGGN